MLATLPAPMGPLTPELRTLQPPCPYRSPGHGSAPGSVPTPASPAPLCPVLAIPSCLQTARSIRRRHCYPPTWKRWAFYLCPGALIAAAAVLLYAFVETEENYFYIHSIWHMLIAGSVGFLLPPRAKPDGRLAPLPRRKGCGYQLCVNEQEELGLVDPGAASINSICAS